MIIVNEFVIAHELLDLSETSSNRDLKKQG
jgi:hypothetical protein